MECKTSGIILRTRPLTESSLIVHWLTPDLGRIATAAKGARRPKSPFRGKLDLFHSAEFTFVRSRRGDLHSLCEVSIRDFHIRLRHELAALEQASWLTRMIEQTTETETPIPEIHELFKNALGFLVMHPPDPIASFAFGLKLLQELGLRPDFGKAHLTAGARQILVKLLNSAWSELPRIKLSSDQTNEIRTYLTQFFAVHTGARFMGRD